MAGKKLILQAMKLENKNIKEVADMLGILEQSFRNKLTRDAFSHSDLVKILKLLNTDVQGKHVSGAIIQED